jgi:CHAT domain-containing protein/tetratricopeptide (TPR) repeat protein
LERKLFTLAAATLIAETPPLLEGLRRAAMGGRRQAWHVRAALTCLIVLWAAAAGLEALAQDTNELAALNEQVEEFYQAGKYTKATQVAKQSLALAERQLGPDHPLVGTALNNLARLYGGQGRYVEAEPLYQRSLAIREKALGPEHPDVAQSLNNLAQLYDTQGRYAEAEPLQKRGLAIREKTLGHEHLDVAESLNALGLLYAAQGRYAEAEPLCKRGLAIREKALGPEHPDVAQSLNNLATLYYIQGRYAEAEPVYRRGLTIQENALGSDHLNVSASLNNLAVLYDGLGRYAEAEPLYQRSLAIREKALGPEHPVVAQSLNNLAGVHRAQGRYADAERLFQRSLAILEKALGPDHPIVGRSLNNLAALYLEQRDWSRAADYWRRGTALLVHRAERVAADVGRAMTGKSKGEAEQQSYQFWGLVKVTNRLAAQDRSQEATLALGVFQTAQWGQRSEAAGSLAQMAARGAKGEIELSRLVRERQDLVEEWQERDAVRSFAVAQAPNQRDGAAEAANVSRLDAIDTRISAIDRRLAAEYADYAALVRPTPLSVQEVQAHLSAGEALVLVLDTVAWKPMPEETFVWVVTKTDMRWVRSHLGTATLRREVAALRCGLDAGLWDDAAAAIRCLFLLKDDPVKAGPERDVYGNILSETLPFARTRALALYKALFGQVEDLIRDKHLLIVPSGPLTQLPFQVLVTAATTGTDYRSTAWLARKHAITVLPAVSSLKALRRVAKASAAAKPMLGIGNPLLDGDAGDAGQVRWAALAKQKQVCRGLSSRSTETERKARGVLRVVTKGAHPDLNELRSLMPLPDTADELCAVANDLRVSPDDIVLGAKATETTIKQLDLTKYRVIHFATHGVLAGDIAGTSEPGLILTPPKEPSDMDDGYLSASEVAALKLDADWVILSACNTAAGGAKGAEALSGLARAFIYAGARALLVSHWSVDSAATVKLITSAVSTITRDAKVGRAEALRRAMLAMIDSGDPRESHPAFWAPFVVVGEGAVIK